MRLLIVSQYFWPETFGINRLVRTLSDADVEVTVLTGKPNYPEGRIFGGYKIFNIQRESYGGAEVVRLPLIPRGNRSPLRLALNYLSFILSAYLLAPFLLRGRRVDAVFVYAPSPLLQALPAIFLAWLKRAPLVVWVQDLWPESLSATGFIRNECALNAVAVAVRYIYRCADSILIQSEAFRVPILRMVKDAGKIHYYPNSAETDADTSTPDIGESVISELASALRNNFSVVFTGNIGTAQSIETIVEAAEKLRDRSDIRFFVVGSGSREDWLVAEILRRKLGNIELTGRLPAEAMPKIFSTASVLLATLRDEPILAYTIPSKLQAYLAAGRPIIACMNGEGARVVVESGAGVSCGAEDSAALANEVLKMQGLSCEERLRMGERGRHYFSEHYEPGKLAKVLIGHLESLCASCGGSAG
jgi:glycosyltransferase involved in cell wall biosynthesis